MSIQDAVFNNQIFRKDNPIILACRRDQAVLMGIRVVYDGNDYQPGQALVRKASDGLFYRWSAASGGSYDSPCVLLQQIPAWQMSANNGGVTGGVSGSALSVGVIKGIVYTAKLTEADSGFKTQLKSKDYTDAGAVALTSF